MSGVALSVALLAGLLGLHHLARFALWALRRTWSLDDLGVAFFYVGRFLAYYLAGSCIFLGFVASTVSLWLVPVGLLNVIALMVVLRTTYRALTEMEAA